MLVVEHLCNRLFDNTDLSYESCEKIARLLGNLGFKLPIRQRKNETVVTYQDESLIVVLWFTPETLTLLMNIKIAKGWVSQVNQIPSGTLGGKEVYQVMDWHIAYDTDIRRLFEEVKASLNNEITDCQIGEYL
jgi:hypothetical protein